MNGFTRVLPLLLLAAATVVGQGADLEKAVQQAVASGELAKARELCDRWVKSKPEEVLPRLVSGRLYVKADQLDEALEQFEIAREMSPEDPEPICGAGTVFLAAGMAEEAIAEFKTALELRTDHAPAAKGLAEAEALLLDPHAGGVGIRLGELNDERGLRQLSPQWSRVVTVGDQECRATDQKSQRPFLYFDVDDAYLHKVDVPVRVTVEYFDQGTDRFYVKYDSTDTGAHQRGAGKKAGPVTKGNTGKWKRHTFSLPDARMAHPHRGDIVLCATVGADRDDLYVSWIHVVLGGLGVRTEPQVVAADGTGTCVVTATVFDAEGPVPDGTLVRFSTTRGVIEPEAETVGGEAEAELQAGEGEGEAVITVEAGEDKQAVAVPILAGRGTMVRRKLVVDRFDKENRWVFSGSKGTHMAMALAPEHTRGGRPSTRLRYRLVQEDSTSIAGLRRSVPLPGLPVKLGMWVDADGTNNTMRLEVVDATGQVHGYQVGLLRPAGWQYLAVDLGPAMYSSGGARDGRLHPPLKFRQLRLRRYYGNRGGKCEGEIYLQDLAVLTDLPGSETVELAVTPGHPRSTFSVGEDVVFHARLGNLTGEPYRGRFRWSVKDGKGAPVGEGQSQEVEVRPETRATEALKLALTRPGVYRGTVLFEAHSSLAQDSPRSAPVDVAFLLLRDMAELGVSAAIGPAPGGAEVSLASARKDTVELGLSYHVLNRNRESLRTGSLGPPTTTLEAGEEIECPLRLEGLPVGRYQTLLLIDLADGQRYSKLLSHDVFPETFDLAGRVADESGKPVAGASVRVHLAREAYGGVGPRGETRTWTVRTDKEGKYGLNGLKVPLDARDHRLSVDVVADGFIDGRQFSGLGSRLRSGGEDVLLRTISLEPGVRLVGRVVGADGQPVPDATVQAASFGIAPGTKGGMGAVMSGPARGSGRKGSASMGGGGGMAAMPPAGLATTSKGGVTVTRVSGVPRRWPHRPREADAEGRFVLFVPADAKVGTVVRSSKWVAAYASAAVSQQREVEVRLERGTRVSGTLLDGHGDPAVGYWVVAERKGSGRSGMPVRVAAKSGPKGAFELPPLKGRYVISTPASFAFSLSEPAQTSPLPTLAMVPREESFDGSVEHVKLDLRASPAVRLVGRITNVDGTPLERVGVVAYCRAGTPGRQTLLDGTVTGQDGSYVFEALPQGAKGVRISVPAFRACKGGPGVYLRAKPLAPGRSTPDGGSVCLAQLDRDVQDIDFRFSYWSSEHGYLDASPASGPKAAAR